MEAAARELRRPEDERIARQAFARALDGDDDDEDDDKAADKPLVRRDNMFDLIDEVSDVPPGEPYDRIVEGVVEQVDAEARRAGEWAALAWSYDRLAEVALKRGQPERADRYVDRLLAILREHPELVMPGDDIAKGVGPVRAVTAGSVAALLTDAGRHADLKALLDAHGDDDRTRLDMLLGVALAHVWDRKLEQAREFIEAEVRPVAPRTADRLTAAIDGEVPAPPAADGDAPPADLEISERRLGTCLLGIAHAHARRGDVETAGGQLRALRYKGPPGPDGAGELRSYEWAELAWQAAEYGHSDGARAGFARALEAEEREFRNGPGKKADPKETAKFEERRGFVREAIDLGVFKLARRLLSSTSAPGAGARHQLARAYRERSDAERGDAERADALTEEAIQIATGGRGEGDVLAEIAVDLHAAGQVERAEALLSRAMDHIEGVDFGFSGTAAIVRAAVEMNRVDLLDRLYASYEDPGAKMLLCMVATRAGLFPAEGDE